MSDVNYFFPLSDNYNSRFPLASQAISLCKAGETVGARWATGVSPAGRGVSPRFSPCSRRIDF